MNIHVRFALYALLITAGFATLGASWNSVSPWFFVSLMCMFSALKLFGKERSSFLESGREVSDRALFWGFLGFLVVFWVGGFYVAFHLNPAHPPMGLLWTFLGLAWLAWLYRGYRWWRAPRREVDV